MNRVGITTTSDAFAHVAAGFTEAGLVPVSLPCIRVTPAESECLDRLRDSAAAADWIVLTSRRSVEALWPRGGMPSTPTAVTGPATASAVERAGGTVGIVGVGGSEELRHQLAAVVPGCSVVFPHAEGAAPEMLRLLTAAARDVIAGAAYATSSIPPPNDEVEAVAFGSPSAVRGWAMTRSFELVVAAIGLTTAAALTARGRPPDVIAERPTFSTLSRTISRTIRSTT
jgi:uroporphyrinogen-III synthase